MSVQLKLRREAAAFLATFTGAVGELLVDITTWRAQVHDGATAGGHPLALVVDLPFPILTPSSVSASTGQTLTAVQLVGGLISRSGLSGGVTDTTATATAILGQIPNGVIGSSFRCRYVNTTGQVITLAGGTGVTLLGSTTIAANASVDLLAVVTATGSPAVTLSIK